MTIGARRRSRQHSSSSRGRQRAVWQENGSDGLRNEWIIFRDLNIPSSNGFGGVSESLDVCSDVQISDCRTRWYVALETKRARCRPCNQLLTLVLATPSLAGSCLRFEVVSTTLSGATRTFQSLSDAAHENGMSRVYGGNHFLHAVQEGCRQGKSVGRVVSRLLAPTPEGGSPQNNADRPVKSKLCLHDLAP
jgi:hypothetical protein